MSDAIPAPAPLRYDADGFVIRIYRPEDAFALRTATTSSYEHLKPWMAWVKQEVTDHEADTTCRRLISRYLTDEEYAMGIWDGDRVVGGTGFHLRCGPVDWKCAEIGMWIAGDQAGKGLGTRVLEAMLAWGFTEWGWERLVWKCDTLNLASARVAEKCGLTREATFRSDSLAVDGSRRDSYLYAILKEEWMAR